MGWDGYLALDGNEIGNWQRFEAYAGDRSWFRRTYRGDGVGYALGQTYTDPVTDAAPWWDPDVTVSGDLYGFCPSAITGLDDSSGDASTVESTKAGGVPGRVRLATKEVNVAGFIAGASEAAVEYGLIWFRRTLLAGLCSPLDARKQALGTDLTFFGYEPPTAASGLIDGISAQQALNAVSRTYRSVVVSTPPRVMSKGRASCGDFIAQVQFTLRVGDPYIYANPKRVFVSLFDTPVWGTDVTAGSIGTTTFDEVSCGNPNWEPLYDPECSIAITPPTPPNVPLGCWTPPVIGNTFDRTVVTIPAANFEAFTEMLPILTITNDGDPMRNIRIRFYRDLDGTLDLDANPCAFVSDIVVSFLPTGTLVIDGSREQAHITTSGGHTRRADSLIFGTDLRPVDWPVLDCGSQYLMTVDTLGTDAPPPIDLDIIARAA